MATNLKSVL